MSPHDAGVQPRIPYGHVNPHIIGIVMKETVRRAIVAIRAQRFIFEATAKAGRSGNFDDVVTTADHAAQAIYLKTLRECFPEFGVIAEENAMRVDSLLPDAQVYFSVDPLDGTKAFVRKQSHGIGTMVALASNGEVIAAYVGDVMTQEVYGFRPASAKVHRISEFDHAEALTIRPDLRLSRQNILLRTAPHRYSATIRRLISGAEARGLFKGIDITSGSIGTGMARLWKGEVGAAALTPGIDTPWDMWPIIGISRQLGLIFLRDAGHGRLERFEPAVSIEATERNFAVLIIHESRLGELTDFLS